MQITRSQALNFKLMLLGREEKGTTFAEKPERWWTNVDLKDIDNAVMRPGRLSARVEVGLLDVGQAQKVYERIRTEQSTSPQWDKQFYSVAELYAMAKGAVYESNSTNPIGFKK